MSSFVAAKQPDSSDWCGRRAWETVWSGSLRTPGAFGNFLRKLVDFNFPVRSTSFSQRLRLHARTLLRTLSDGWTYRLTLRATQAFESSGNTPLRLRLSRLLRKLESWERAPRVDDLEFQQF